MKTPHYLEGDCVSFTLGSLTGTGYIRGIATIAQPVIGACMIVEIETVSQNISDIYAYSHISIPEVCLERKIQNPTKI